MRLYPPVGQQTEALANGTTVTAPFNGYQLIPVALVSAGTGSEDNGWLQDASGCANAQISSNNYFFSQEYLNKLNSTSGFYKNLLPIINGTFTNAADTFKNAYSSKSICTSSIAHMANVSISLRFDPCFYNSQL